MRMHSISLSKKDKKTTAENSPVVAFISSRPYQDSDAGTKAAFDRLSQIDGFSVRFLTFAEIEKKSKQLERFSILWIHKSDSAPFNNLETHEKFVVSVKKYVENGGKILLSQQAVHYLNVFGYESRQLRDSLKICRDEGFGRRLGYHAFRDHPLFTGLNGGAYVQKPDRDLRTLITGFFGEDQPSGGKVVAVDWDYIFLREDTKIILEYTPGKGKILAVGAYLDFLEPNRNGEHLTAFTTNCLKYLSGQIENNGGYYWNYASRAVTECTPIPESDKLLKAIPLSEKWELNENTLTLKRRFATENFWDVAGERLLTMGPEKGGIGEVWAHPFMAFRDYKVGIRFSYRDTIYWLNDERPEISVDPQCFSRLYKFSRAYLKEIIVNHPENPTGVIHYEYRGVYPAELVIQFKSNFRWMWPYSERVTGSICHSWNSDVDAIILGDHSGDLSLMMGATRKPVFHLTGQFDGFTEAETIFKGNPTENIEAAGLLIYRLEMNDNLDVVYSATAEGAETTYKQYDEAIHNPGKIFEDASRHVKDLLARNLVITTPDSIFNTGYRWALLATDRFFVNTTGMGKAFVAGYSTTRHGWDGGHKVNGRPGYGWYFGRDAEWSGFAVLDYGDFGKIREQLEFFNKYQDLNGKIFHEASTSGLIHYDAADATPLYIVLAGKYFRHTNDTAFLRRTWPNIVRALSFCFSTDTDDDHLIENTNVGHGWVEGGKLFGSHSTIYMAGSWGAALREAAGMANFMHDPNAGIYGKEADGQKKIIDSRFWDDYRKFYAYGMDKDRTFRHVQTILPAVPVYFRMTDPAKAGLCVKEYAGNAFTTNWGARILRDDNPWFKPSGYHYGSVWPLFTGWAALAGYRTGNAVQGYSYIMNNLNVYRNWGLGFVEEVLNGSEYAPSGVCSHQCWSETMVLQPSIEGMLGIEINAQENRVILAPNLPVDWDSLTVQNIRIAEQTFSFAFKRKNGTYEYTFTLNGGKPVGIDFNPVFPAGTRFNRVTLNNRDVPFTTFKTMQSMSLMSAFEIPNEVKFTVETEDGIGVLPLISNPKPGDPAEGMRILSTRLAGDEYLIEVEGVPRNSGILELWSGNDRQFEITGATFLNKQGRISKLRVDFGPSESKYLSRIISVKTSK